MAAFKKQEEKLFGLNSFARILCDHYHPTFETLLVSVNQPVKMTVTKVLWSGLRTAFIG